MPGPADLTPARLRTIAERAARRAGALVAAAFQDRPRDDVSEKARGDFVTRIDRQVESALREWLLDATPEAGFLGEESEPTGAERSLIWVVDPIDGTSNFAQGLRSFAVSVAALRDSVPVAAACWTADGAVYDAARGDGARQNGTPFATPKPPEARAQLIGLQWFRPRRDLQAVADDWVDGLIRREARLRCFGSTVLQILDCAVGRLHANIQPLGRIWDLAAVALIAEEAGCRATDWSGQPLFPGFDPDGDRASVVAPDTLHRELLELLSGPEPSGAR